MKLLILGLSTLAVTTIASAQLVPISRVSPAVTADRWWNSPKAIELGHGKVTIVHFWTFGCSNCQHNQPIYNRWVDKYRGTDVQILGVHTPETPSERKVSNVQEYIRSHQIRYPVAFDLSGTNWARWQNRYWPSVYLVDKHGQVRYRWEGELVWDGQRGDLEIEKQLARLINER